MNHPSFGETVAKLYADRHQIANNCFVRNREAWRTQSCGRHCEKRRATRIEAQIDLLAAAKRLARADVVGERRRGQVKNSLLDRRGLRRNGFR